MKMNILPKLNFARAIWLVCFIAVVILILFENSLFFMHESSIGKFTESDTHVTLRDAENVQWREVKINAPIHAGDEVAVGARSSAAIGFTQGRSIELGEDTVASVKAISYKNDQHIIVNLTSGTIKANIARDTEYKLTIYAGSDTYAIDAKKAPIIQKKAGEKSRTLPVENWKKSEFKKLETVAAPIIAQAPAVTPSPTVTQDLSHAPLKPLIAKDCLFPDLKTSTTLYTDLGFDKIAQETIDIPLSKSESCALKIFLSNGKEIKLSAAANKKKYSIKIEALTRARSQKILPNGLESIQFVMAIEKNAKRKYTFEILSSEKLFNSNQPVSISFSKIPTASAAPALAPVIINNSAQNLEYSVSSRSASQLKKIASLLKNAENILISEHQSYDDVGYFAAKNGIVQAQMKAKKLTAEQTQWFLNITDADLVFLGHAKAVMPLAQADTVMKTGQAGIYVDYKAKFFQVSGKFFKPSLHLSEFLRRYVQSIFIEAVDIVARKKAP